ncbi:hypothetical protein ACPPVQ_02280 [Diaminobutyricibacter sp. McL0618]|uniref:hypothetical protein n=1 Tax=Leifsonia sp. McL0618 TaxID=3415677 RepID=UPI003CEDD135
MGVGASAGVALVAPLAASGSAAGYSAAFWLCCGLVIVGLYSASVVRVPDPVVLVRDSAEPALAIEA